MSEIRNLEPKVLWQIFDDITKVPRPSKKEEKIIAYLIDFAKKHKLEYKQDKIGNVLIIREASKSMKGKSAVVLQSHMDMVCEKNSDVKFDFDNDPIQTYIDDGWVKARGTTLGADDGIGMAASLAILIANEVEVPKIEALFTVDEETGLTGAFELGKEMLTGEYLLNLDSEDDGEIFIGCAGGIDTLATFTYKAENVPADHIFYQLRVAGLKGGHSGDDIEKGRGNSNKIAGRLLWHAGRELGLRLANFDGGNLRNAIPREATTVFAIPSSNKDNLKKLFKAYEAELKEEYGITEPELSVKLSETQPTKSVIDSKTQSGLLNAIQGIQNGVLAMSFAMDKLVETSTNLASIKFEAGNKIVLTTSQRSSVEGSRLNAAAAIRATLEQAGAKVIHTDGYPGWNPNPKSKLLTVAGNKYEQLFKVKPLVRAIHAGLECGLFLEKYPHLDMISIGPTVRGAHSPDEKLEIVTVDRFWKHLIGILQDL